MRNRSLQIETFARKHRSHPTPSEQKLWSLINHCQLGVWFRRQVPLGRFIADFVAPSVRLVVEVDGAAYHSLRSAPDARRDRALARMGYRILRLDAALVECTPEQAIALIRAALSAR